MSAAITTCRTFSEYRYSLLLVLCMVAISATSAFGQEDRFEKAYRQHRPSVAMVEVTFLSTNEKTGAKVPIQRQGTAFCIDDDGIFLTSYHVIVGAKHPLIMLFEHSGVRFICGVVGVDPKRDLAAIQLLRDDPPMMKPLALATARRQLNPATPVISIGYSRGRTYWGFLDGRINQLFSNRPKIRPIPGREESPLAKHLDVDEILRTTIKPSRGHSGGPVLDLLIDA